MTYWFFPFLDGNGRNVWRFPFRDASGRKRRRFPILPDMIEGGDGDGDLEELAFANFRTGTYRVGGASAAVSDIVVEDAGADWSTFDPLTDITADGLVGFPVIASGLETTLLSSGFTVIGTFMPTGTIGSVLIDAYDSPDYSKEWKIEAAYDEDVASSNNTNAIAADDHQATTPVADKDAVIKFAATITASRVSISINGGSVLTATTADAAIYNNIGIGPTAAAIHTLTFNPPQDDADLPTLSAL